VTATVTGIPAVPDPAVSDPATAGPAISGPAAQACRRWRAPLAIVAVIIAVIIAGRIVVALLQPPAGTTGYLDPGNPQPDGARALATLLAERGSAVIHVSTVNAAAAAATPGASSGPSPGRQGPVTLLITDPGLLTISQLKSLAQVPGDRAIVDPAPAVLAVLAPGVTDVRQVPVQPLPPQCGLPAARLAGFADLGGAALHTTVPGAGQCYPVNGHPSLVRYSAGGRVITVLGTSAPLTNSSLAQLGNAALSLNLLGGSSRIIWLVPTPPAPGAAPNGQQAFTSIVVLLTDLNRAALAENLLPHVALLASRHQLLVGAVADPRVDELAAGRGEAGSCTRRLRRNGPGRNVPRSRRSCSGAGPSWWTPRPSAFRPPWPTPTWP